LPASVTDASILTPTHLTSSNLLRLHLPISYDHCYSASTFKVRNITNHNVIANRP